MAQFTCWCTGIYGFQLFALRVKEAHILLIKVLSCHLWDTLTHKRANYTITKIIWAVGIYKFSTLVLALSVESCLSNRSL